MIDQRHNTHSQIGVFEEKTLKSERLYEGSIVNLRRDTVSVRSGKEAFREVVEHNGGVCVIGLTDDGFIPFVRQYRKPTEKVLLELPAGKLELVDGQIEDPKIAAAREFQEETGYVVADLKLLLNFFPTPGYCTEVLSIYLATGLLKGEVCFDENEALEPVLIHKDEAIEMVKNGNIEDGKTVLGILLADLFLREEAYGSIDS